MKGKGIILSLDFFTESSEKLASRFVLPLSILAVSFAAIFVRFSEANPIAIAFYRMFFSTLILLPFVPIYFQEFKNISRKQLITLILLGFFLAAHMAAWISSLEYTTVASSVVIVTSHPLIVSWLSSRYLNEKTTKKAYLGIIIALAGISLMAFSDYQFSEWGLLGDSLAFIAMILVSGYIIKGREMRKKISILPYVFTVYGFSTVFLAIFSFPVSGTFQIFAAREYMIFLALAIIPTMLGHTLYNWSLKFVNARIASISLIGEPIGSSVLAFLILQEVPPNLTIVGAAIALVGIYYCQRYG